ncbi:CPCC family cysteine-rich protein [Cupriavidus plantarum]|uniref:CPCC family cysteine-rich protein n=1 Tax=Cupriavidus plantarum TaxID=942865 RepID=UPI00339D953C
MDLELDCQCDCCDYLTLSKKGDSQLCPVCFWEDDPACSFTKADARSEANHGLTLREARESFCRIGASCDDMLAHVLPPHARTHFRRVSRAE